jgi:hypothetical protein
MSHYAQNGENVNCLKMLDSKLHKCLEIIIDFIKNLKKNKEILWK